MKFKWSTDDSEAGEAKILKGPRFTGGVKKRVQEQGDVGCQERRAGETPKHTLKNIKRLETCARITSQS